LSVVISLELITGLLFCRSEVAEKLQTGSI
jgi:hypothetical protein